MNNGLAKLFSAAAAAFCLFGAVICTDIRDSALRASAADYISNGTDGSYTYSVWNQNDIGTVEFENTDNNGFTASWDGIIDFSAVKGITFEENTVSAYQVREYKMDYDIDIQADGYDYIGISGWFTYPRIQFNIVEAWDSWRPPGSDYGDPIASAEIDGTTYDIYKGIFMFPNTTIPNAYWSVARRDPFEPDKETNIRGTVDIAAHFRAWSEAGLELGFIQCIDFDLEAYDSSGHAAVNLLDTKYDIAEEQQFGPPMPVKPYEEHEPLPVRADGKIIKEDFEKESDKTGAQGESASAVITEEHCYSGKSSMHISSSGGHDCQSFYYELDPYDLPPLTGKEQPYNYMTGARIYHNAGSDVQFTVSLVEYNDNSDTCDIIDELGTRTCRSGQWTNINDLMFSFEHDVFCKYRIVFTPAKPVDFCIDDLYIAEGDETKNGRQFFDAGMRGDLNCDGAIDSFDVALCRKAVINALDSGMIETEGDVNGDFMSDISDLVLLTKYVLRISDDIPLSEEGSVLYLGSHYDYHATGERSLDVTNVRHNDDCAKTIVREDGSLRAEWNVTDSYHCEYFSDYTNAPERKSCDGFDISYSADIRSSGKTEFQLRGIINSHYGSLSFNIYEGWTDHGLFGDYAQMLSDEKDVQIVTLNGNEYYMTKYNGITGHSIDLYRRENPLVLNETCHVENSFNLEELLKFRYKEYEVSNYVLKAGIFIISDGSTGYADLIELKLAGN